MRSARSWRSTASLTFSNRGSQSRCLSRADSGAYSSHSASAPIATTASSGFIVRPAAARAPPKSERL